MRRQQPDRREFLGSSFTLTGARSPWPDVRLVAATPVPIPVPRRRRRRRNTSPSRRPTERPSRRRRTGAGSAPSSPCHRSILTAIAGGRRESGSPRWGTSRSLSTGTQTAAPGPSGAHCSIFVTNGRSRRSFSSVQFGRRSRRRRERRTDVSVDGTITLSAAGGAKRAADLQGRSLFAVSGRRRPVRPRRSATPRRRSGTHGAGRIRRDCTDRGFSAPRPGTIYGASWRPSSPDVYAD